MTEGRAVDEDWKVRALQARRRRRAPWLYGSVILVSGAGLIAIGRSAADGLPRSALLLAGLLMVVFGFVFGAAAYIRAADEQERQANLWACALGLWVYLALFGMRVLFEAFDLPPPISHEGVFLITMAVAGVVFLRQRFR